MKLSTVALGVILQSAMNKVTAFTLPSSTTFYKASTSLSLQQRQTTKLFSSEFDSILGEGTGSSSSSSSSSSDGGVNTNNIVGLPDSSGANTLSASAAVMEEDDIFGDAAPSTTSSPKIEELIRKKQQQAIQTQTPKTPLTQSAKNFLKGKDFGELFFFVFVPLTAGYYLSKKAYDLSTTKLQDKSEDTLTDYANEMIFHDGDFEEMKMCQKDYEKKMMWMGPKKNDLMIKTYLEFYAKKKTVSPQAISSLSYVFSMYKLSEEKAAQILVELCTTMPEKIASVGKLYFFGSHILKTPAAKSKLQPIHGLLASSYRDDVMGGGVSPEEIVDKSQVAMGEAAYRAAVSAAGKNQEDLTIGWEVLGLDKEKATEIWTEVAKGGFVSDREAKYASKTAKQTYDSKGRKTDEEGKLENPDEATDDDDEEDGGDDAGLGGGTANVQECTECGYTLFVAKGRDFKFFGSGFTCPECGAPKDKFKAVE